MKTKFLLQELLYHPYKFFNLLGLKLSEKTLPLKSRFYPSFINIEPTINCNLDCVMCQRNTLNRKNKTLDLEKFKEILDKIPSLRVVNLQGFGEPFMCKDFLKMVDYGYSKGVRVYAISNGTLINKYISDSIIKSKLQTLIISFDASTKKTYEKIRRGANFDIFIENLKYLFSIRNPKKLELIAWITPSAYNIKEIEDTIKLCINLGFDKIMIQSKLSVYSYKKDLFKTTKNLMIQNQEEFHTFIKSLQSKYSKVDICDSKELSQENKCKWPWTSLFISSDGDVIPCCVVSDQKIANFGNIFKAKHIKDIWNNPSYINLRKKIKENKLPFYCKDCYSK